MRLDSLVTTDPQPAPEVGTERWPAVTVHPPHSGRPSNRPPTSLVMLATGEPLEALPASTQEAVTLLTKSGVDGETVVSVLLPLVDGKMALAWKGVPGATDGKAVLRLTTPRAVAWAVDGGVPDPLRRQRRQQGAPLEFEPQRGPELGLVNALQLLTDPVTEEQYPDLVAQALDLARWLGCTAVGHLPPNAIWGVSRRTGLVEVVKEDGSIGGLVWQRPDGKPGQYEIPAPPEPIEHQNAVPAATTGPEVELLAVPGRDGAPTVEIVTFRETLNSSPDSGALDDGLSEAGSDDSTVTVTPANVGQILVNAVDGTGIGMGTGADVTLTEDTRPVRLAASLRGLRATDVRHAVDLFEQALRELEPEDPAAGRDWALVGVDPQGRVVLHVETGIVTAEPWEFAAWLLVAGLDNAVNVAIAGADAKKLAALRPFFDEVAELLNNPVEPMAWTWPLYDAETGTVAAPWRPRAEVLQSFPELPDRLAVVLPDDLLPGEEMVPWRSSPTALSKGKSRRSVEPNGFPVQQPDGTTVHAVGTEDEGWWTPLAQSVEVLSRPEESGLPRTFPDHYPQWARTALDGLDHSRDEHIELAVREVLPRAWWVKDHVLKSPDAETPAVFPILGRPGFVFEVVAAGGWIRTDGEPDPFIARKIRSTVTKPSPVVWYGNGLETVPSKALLDAARTVLRGLLQEVFGSGELRLAAQPTGGAVIDAWHLAQDVKLRFHDPRRLRVGGVGPAPGKTALAPARGHRAPTAEVPTPLHPAAAADGVEPPRYLEAALGSGSDGAETRDTASGESSAVVPSGNHNTPGVVPGPAKIPVYPDRMPLLPVSVPEAFVRGIQGMEQFPGRAVVPVMVDQEGLLLVRSESPGSRTAVPVDPRDFAQRLLGALHGTVVDHIQFVPYFVAQLTQAGQGRLREAYREIALSLERALAAPKDGLRPVPRTTRPSLILESVSPGTGTTLGWDFYGPEERRLAEWVWTDNLGNLLPHDVPSQFAARRVLVSNTDLTPRTWELLRNLNSVLSPTLHFVAVELGEGIPTLQFNDGPLHAKVSDFATWLRRGGVPDGADLVIIDLNTISQGRRASKSLDRTYALLLGEAMKGHIHAIEPNFSLTWNRSLRTPQLLPPPHTPLDLLDTQHELEHAPSKRGGWLSHFAPGTKGTLVGTPSGTLIRQDSYAVLPLYSPEDGSSAVTGLLVGPTPEDPTLLDADVAGLFRIHLTVDPQLGVIMVKADGLKVSLDQAEAERLAGAVHAVVGRSTTQDYAIVFNRRISGAQRGQVRSQLALLARFLEADLHFPSAGSRPEPLVQGGRRLTLRLLRGGLWERITNPLAPSRRARLLGDTNGYLRKLVAINARPLSGEDGQAGPATFIDFLD
ncbi:hypothetical protein ACWGI8_40745, partial [Streptomyces sp. NPDC054841]